jgi:hypothetical protein
MAKQRSTSEATSGATLERSARFDVGNAIAFNLGMAMFVIGASWDLLSPSTSDAVFWWKVGLWSLGLAIAGPSWIVGSSLSAFTKFALSSVFVGAIVIAARTAMLQHEIQSSLLQPWRIESNRLVHDGLGMSVAALPGWTCNLQPRLIRNPASGIGPSTHLGTGELAVFLQLTHAQDRSANFPSTILLEGGPEPMDDRSLVQFALGREKMNAQRPGATLLQSTQEGKIDGVPSLMFAYEAPDGRRWQEVVFHSGPCTLTLFSNAASDADLQEIIEFVNSVRIQGREIGFFN